MRPASWTTAVPGTFARRTLEVRVPQILRDTVAANVAHGLLDARALAGCSALLAELETGTLRALHDDGGPDLAWWAVACAPHAGKSWLDLPWYFAESYFYRRVLEAVGYFTTKQDPFLVVKHAEEAAMGPRIAAVRAAVASLPADAALAASLLAALWGNRADLSYAVGRAFGDAGTRDDLLVDDSARALALLAGAGRIAILLDNAGTELACDLLLADALARRGVDVVLYAKAQPFFVSDATPVDVERTRSMLQLAALPVVAHAYMTSSGFLLADDLPVDLRAELAGFDVVIAKGDANYRRLVGDAPWPHDTAVDVVMDMPALVLALRTCKAEVCVGVPLDVAARAKARSPDWLVNGQFGMVQLSRDAAQASRRGSRANGP